jgi:hypothetical protein
MDLSPTKIPASGNLSNYLKNYKTAQEKLLNMLKEFNVICRKYGIKYWCSDEIIASVLRNRLWLPFSRDISVSMLFSDYIKFKTKSHELSNSLWVQDPVSDPQHTSYVYKIRDKNSCYLEDAESVSHSGLCIKIYLYEIIENTVRRYRNFGNKNPAKGDFYREWDHDTIFPISSTIFEKTLVYLPRDLIKYCKTVWGEYPPVSLSVKNPLAPIDPENASEKCKIIYKDMYN